MDTSQRRIVIKVGGSLLSQPQFAERFQRWFARFENDCREANILLLAGGGALVDGLRQIEQANRLPEEVSHWAAISLMETQAKLLNAWLPEWKITSKIDPFASSKEDKPGRWIFAAHDFLQHEEPHCQGTRLPIGWQTTSDAIAGRLAVCIDAELILLKSAAPPNNLATDNWPALATAGYIDPVLPQLVGELASCQIRSDF